jgi:3-oxoacyl-[acyl-carrier-protein] synthase-3
MTRDELAGHLLSRLHEVQARIGRPPAGASDDRFADVIDSMGMVEFIGQVADDCSVEPEAIEQLTGLHFSTISDLATVLHQAGLLPKVRPAVSTTAALAESSRPRQIGLLAWSVRLPNTRQPAEQIDELLNRPKGWFAGHTGIAARCLWAGVDPLDSSAEAARECLSRSGTAPESVTALLVTSEAPPVPVGLAAALHTRIGLPANCVALEVGGACTGLVSALWLARRLLDGSGAVLIVAVESPSTWLSVQPGPSGETAALFGDGAGACLIAHTRGGGRRIRDVLLFSDGKGAPLFQVLPGPPFQLAMEGTALAIRAVRTVADLVLTLAHRNGLSPADLESVVIHGGNGRLPGLLARRLGLPEERILSETAHTGNLGSVSLLAAWNDKSAGPVVWAAIGAGLSWGGLLLE